MTPRRFMSRVLLAAFVPSIAGVLAAQSRDTLETKVTVTNTEITFKWSNKHPWDAQLIANGASLFAEYQTANGPGVECLQPANGTAAAAPNPIGRGRVPAPRATIGGGGCYAGNAVFRKDDRTIQFRLPDRLAAEPTGAVCLQLRMPDQRLLPVRAATKTGGDTARFQVEEWSKQVTAGAKRARLDARRTELQSAIATQLHEITEQEASNRTKGWDSAEACSTQKGGTVEVQQSGRPVAAPNEQDVVARQVCTVRVANGDDGLVKPPEEMLSYLNLVDPERRAAWLRLRGAQLKQFIDDWARYAPLIAAYKARHPDLPHFGTYANYIPIQSLAGQALLLIQEAVKLKKPVDPTDVFGYAGATVEAYNRCVSDGKEQLALNYQQAIGLAATVETLPERLRQQAVQACQTGVSRLTGMRSRLAGFERDLTALESELGAALTSPAVTIRSRELNAVTCSP